MPTSNLERRLKRIETRMGHSERQRRNPFELVFAFNPWLEAHPEEYEELRQLLFAISDDATLEAWELGDWQERADISPEQRAALTAWDARLSRCLMLAAQDDASGIIVQHLTTRA